jgi:hypothetical protein
VRKLVRHARLDMLHVVEAGVGAVVLAVEVLELALHALLPGLDGEEQLLLARSGAREARGARGLAGRGAAGLAWKRKVKGGGVCWVRGTQPRECETLYFFDYGITTAIVRARYI